MPYVFMNDLVYMKKHKISHLVSSKRVSRLSRPIEQKKKVAAFINVYCR